MGFQNKKDTSMRKQVRSLVRKEVVNLRVTGSQVEDLSRWSEPRGNCFLVPVASQVPAASDKEARVQRQIGGPMLTCNKQQQPSELDHGDGGGVK